MVERKETAGALVEGLLTPPASRREVRSVLREALRGVEDRRLARDELAERLESATARAAELELVLPHDVGICLPLIACALGRGGGAFPRLLFEPPPGALDIDPEDEEGLEDLLEVVLEDFDEHVRAAHGEEGPVFQGGDYVAGSMLHWKHGYGDGRLGRWTRADVEEYLLDFFPRKLSADPDLIACTPDCVAAFLAFLDQRELLTGDPLAELEAACRDLRPAFERTARDRDRWGPAKAITAQMLADGVDLADERAVANWMDDFNARPRAERDRRSERSRQVPRAQGAATVDRIGAASARRRAPRASATGADRAGRAKARYSGGSGPSSSRSTIPKLISPPSISASSDLSSRAADAISSRKTWAPFSSSTSSPSIGAGLRASSRLACEPFWRAIEMRMPPSSGTSVLCTIARMASAALEVMVSITWLLPVRRQD